MIKSTYKKPIKNILTVLTGLYLFFALGYALNVALTESAHAENKPDGKTPEASHAAPVQAPLLPPGSQAPPFRLQSALGNESIALSDYKGKKKVLVEYFATWCPHCQHSVPILKKLDAEYPSQLQVLSVNVGDRPGNPTSLPFIEQYKINYPVLVGANNLLAQSYKVSGVPTIYLIDESGVIRWNHVGSMTSKDAAEIEKLLKKKQ